jgi:hypothetical protein
MRKIRLLLVAVFALMGMSAFAQLPTDKSIGYLYDAAAKKFINAEGKVGATGMPFKALKQGSSKDYTTKDGTSRTFTSYRFKTTDEKNGLGVDNTNGTTASTNGIVTSTGTYGYGVFAVVPVGETGFRIMSTYNRADFNVDYLYDYCLGYKEDGTLFCFPEAEAPVWQFVDEETYKAIVAENAMPKKNDVGYLYNPATKQFITSSANMGDNGVEFVIADFASCGESFGSDDGKIYEAGYTYIRIKLNGTSDYMRMSNSGVICTGSGYHKWAAIGTEKGLVIRCIYSSTQGNGALSPFAQQGYYLTPNADGKLALVETPTDASYWQYMDKATYDALNPIVIAKEFPEAGAVGYLYNPAANLFINKDAKLAAKGDAVTIINEGANGDFINLRFEFSAGNRLNFNGESGMSGTGTSYAKFAVKETEKGLIMTHAYPNPDNPAWMKAQNLAGTYMVANGEELGFKALEEIGEYGYWQFVNQETYEKILEILASEPLIRPLLNASPLATDGTTKQYLYNLKAKGFLVGANDWGTRASISTDEGILFSVQDNGDGTYALVSPRGTVGVDGGNSWIDSNGRFQERYTINFNDDGTFTIGNTAVGGYLSLDPSKADDTRLYFTAEATKWIAVSEADYPVCKPEVAAYAAAYKGVVDAYKKSISSNKLVKYTSVAELNGVSFSIINEADGKAVYGTNAQNLAYDTYDKAFANTNSGYKYTLEAIDGGYLVRLMTPSGSPYSVWGNPGYVNSGAPGGFNGCFVLGLNNQNGQDVANGAVWEIEYVEGKGFTMKNKALGGYFAGNSPAPSGTDPIYWTFGELVVDNGNPLYKDYLAALNAVEAIYPNSLTESKQAKVQALLSKYAVNKVLNSIATESSINAAIEALNVVGKEIQLTNLIAEAKDCLKEEMSSAAKENLTAVIDEYDGVEFESLKEITDATNAVQDAIAAAKASAATIADYRNAIAAARAILPETMPAYVLVPLDKAINDYPENKVLTADATDETVGAAATALWNAYNAAKTTVDSSKALMGMYELMQNNNVVTPEAYDIYMGKFEEYNKQWQAGTLAENVVNPYNLNGYKNTSLDYDDYLLSTWTIGGEQCVDFGTPLYINTWSVEGEGDGTNFKVPFFEYWTDNANSLGENELEATLADVEPGLYQVTAWVRVRAKNGTTAADATGITLQLNDGEAVDVTEGEAVGPFNLAEYTAEGTVEDGTLKVKFSVAGDNNISWLSFQNVKYEKTGDITTAISEVSSKTAAKSVFNVAGQKLSAPAKGLNIIDGKKVYVK